MPSQDRLKKPNIEAEIRQNSRGGWEIAEPGLPPGSPFALGNYDSWQSALYAASLNFEKDRIRVVHDEPAPKVAKPAPRKPSTKRHHVRLR